MLITSMNSCTGTELIERRNNFIQESSNADVVLFFFSTHGLLFKHATYIVPTSANAGKYLDAYLGQCLLAERLISDVITHCRNAKRIFIFDCCRQTIDESLYL